MADPTSYSVSYSFGGFQANSPTTPLPGASLDDQLAGVSAATAELVASIRDIRRSDGALQNGIVTYDSVSTLLLSNGLVGADPWLTATAYLVGVPVYQAGSLYRCLVAHTSGVFATDLAAAKWLLLAALPTGAPGVDGVDGATSAVIQVTTRTAMKALDTAVYKVAHLLEAGRAGVFAFLAGDYSAHVTADTNEGVYVKATAIAASAGAWVRQFNFVNYQARWFGAVADHTTDSTAIINTIISVSDLVNTNATAGKQGAAYIEIEGGVRFASSSLSFLASGNHVFVYLRYFANSDTSKGVPDGGGGTNERHETSVNSGYPGDATGGMVAEWSSDAPLHPAHILNVSKQMAGADAHFGTGQVRTPTALSPARASYNIKDENVLRWRAVYQSYGADDVSNGVYLQPFNTLIDLNNVGSSGWPTIPAAGTIITGVTSGAIGIKVSHNTTDCFVNFVAGQFLPGEKITDGVTTSTNNIGGGGVTYASTTYPFLGFGFNNPVCTYGVPPGYAVTGFDIGARLTLRKSTGSIGGGAHKETVLNAAALFTNTAAAVPTTGRQVVLDSSNRLVAVNGVSLGTGSTGNGLVGGVAAHCFFPHAGGVSANAFNIATAGPTGTGAYAVTFTNALANANYSVLVTRTNPADFPIYVDGAKTVNGFSLANYNSGGTQTNLVGKIDIVVIGGQ
ncbi:MAG: hypothetical protein WAV72_30635 [Bradyrhizobium sp.]